MSLLPTLNRLRPDRFPKEVGELVGEVNLIRDAVVGLASKGVSFKDNVDCFYYEGVYGSGDFPLTIKKEFKRPMLGIVLVYAYVKDNSSEAIPDALTPDAVEVDDGILIRSIRNMAAGKKYFIRLRVE